MMMMMMMLVHIQSTPKSVFPSIHKDIFLSSKAYILLQMSIGRWLYGVKLANEYKWGIAKHILGFYSELSQITNPDILIRIGSPLESTCWM